MKWRAALAAASLLASSAGLHAGDEIPGGKSLLLDDSAPRFIYQDFEYSKTILDWQEDVTGKPLKILEAGAEGLPYAPGVVLSGAFWGNFLHESTNVGGRFPLLSRFPTERRNRNTSGDRWVVSNAAFATTIRPVSWITGFAQLEYSEVEFPGQEDWQFRKAYVMFGDLERSPFYGYVGRNTVDFGWMDAYNPFTHSVNNHFFRVDSDEPVIAMGYAKDNLHLVGTLIRAGRQLRVADTDGSGFDNGALHADYTFDGLGMSGEGKLRIGGGYLHATIYNNDVPHHPGPSFVRSRQLSPNLTRNSAYDVFAEYVEGPIRLGVEFTSTTDRWPATGTEVEALTLQAAYDFHILDMPSRFSVVFGRGEQGPSGAQFHELTQLAVGFQTEVTEFLTLSAEWIHSESFVPLINIRNVSDASVEADAFVLGAKVQF